MQPHVLPATPVHSIPLILPREKAIVKNVNLEHTRNNTAQPSASNVQQEHTVTLLSHQNAANVQLGTILIRAQKHAHHVWKVHIRLLSGHHLVLHVLRVCISTPRVQLNVITVSRGSTLTVVQQSAQLVLWEQ